MPYPCSHHAIKVALADDHKLIRQAIAHALSADSSFTILFQAENGADLINKLSHYQPDVVLLDIKMPEMSGLEALELIHSRYPDIKTLMLTAFIDEVYIAQCLQFGICGFLSKSMDMTDLSQAIKAAYQGEIFVSNLLNSQIYKNYLVEFRKYNNVSLPKFTQEEIKILDLMKAEKSGKEIARTMYLSQRSIELKRDKMKRKSNTQTSIGLLLYALKRGIID